MVSHGGPSSCMSLKWMDMHVLFGKALVTESVVT